MDEAILEHDHLEEELQVQTIGAAPAAVLAATGHHDVGVCNRDPGGKDLVLSSVWGMTTCLLALHWMSPSPA
jgi:hypothetical protein